MTTPRIISMNHSERYQIEAQDTSHAAELGKRAAALPREYRPVFLATMSMDEIERLIISAEKKFTDDALLAAYDRDQPHDPTTRETEPRLRKLPDEGGNTWFMGSLVVTYWIDDENGNDEVLLSNGKKYKRTENRPGSAWEIISDQPHETLVRNIAEAREAEERADTPWRKRWASQNAEYFEAKLKVYDETGEYPM
jgi:hypothetical protein